MLLLDSWLNSTASWTIVMSLIVNVEDEEKLSTKISQIQSPSLKQWYNIAYINYEILKLSGIFFIKFGKNF